MDIVIIRGRLQVTGQIWGSILHGIYDAESIWVQREAKWEIGEDEFYHNSRPAIEIPRSS